MAILFLASSAAPISPVSLFSCSGCCGGTAACGFTLSLDWRQAKYGSEYQAYGQCQQSPARPPVEPQTAPSLVVMVICFALPFILIMGLPGCQVRLPFLLGQLPVFHLMCRLSREVALVNGSMESMPPADDQTLSAASSE